MIVDCACCARQVREQETHPCEGCEQPICDPCVSEWRMLGAPIACPDCGGSFTTCHAVIVWPEDLSDWAEDRYAMMAPRAG